MPQNEAVTGIIEFQTKPDVDPALIERFFSNMREQLELFTGFIRHDVIQTKLENGSTQNVAIVTFACYRDLRVWLSSKARKEVITNAQFPVEIQRLTTHGSDDVIEVDSLNVREPVKARPPAKWKLALVTEIAVFSAVFCVTEAGLPPLFSKHLRNSFGLTTLGVLLCVVPPLVYAVVPCLTRLAGPWLRLPRPHYDWEPMRTLDEGLSLFVPSPPAVDAGVVANLQERVNMLEGMVQRLGNAAHGNASTSLDDIEVAMKEVPMPMNGLTELRRDVQASPASDLRKALPVTGIAHHHVKFECENLFLQYLADFRKEQEKFPGFLGLTILHGKADGLSDSQEYVSIWKYRTLPEQESAAKSSERQKFLARIKPLLQSPSSITYEQDRYIHDAFSELFVNPGESAPSQPPPVWKSAFLVIVGLLMCVWPVNQNLGPVLADSGIESNAVMTLILTCINVILNTWVCVPFLIFLFGGWLQKPRNPPSNCLGAFFDRGLPCLWANFLAAAVFYGVLAALIATKPEKGW